MKYTFILLILFCSQLLSGQDYRVGLIMPEDDFDVCCIYIPKSGLKLYDKPNGNNVGVLSPGSLDNNKEIYSATIQIGNEKNEFGYENMHMVGYEVMAITFVDSKSNFVKLEMGYWLSVEELTSKKLRPKSWMNYLIEKNTEWYANNPGLNLREDPNTNSNIIATLKGDLWGISTSKETEGDWCRVTVTQYRQHPCSGESNLVIKTLTGWVKIISEEQTPNVWTYTKGC